MGIFFFCCSYCIQIVMHTLTSFVVGAVMVNLTWCKGSAVRNSTPCETWVSWDFEERISTLNLEGAKKKEKKCRGRGAAILPLRNHLVLPSLSLSFSSWLAWLCNTIRVNPKFYYPSRKTEGRVHIVCSLPLSLPFVFLHQLIFKKKKTKAIFVVCVFDIVSLRWNR